MKEESTAVSISLSSAFKAESYSNGASSRTMLSAALRCQGTFLPILGEYLHTFPLVLQEYLTHLQCGLGVVYKGIHLKNYAPKLRKSTFVEPTVDNFVIRYHEFGVQETFFKKYTLTPARNASARYEQEPRCVSLLSAR